jgi:hypothetical protein
MIWAVFFMTPWAAAATLAGAASIPIIIHLLHRKRYRVVEWAAMRFLLLAQKRASRKLRIEQWLLLAVRTLLIMLLIFAMISALPWMDQVWARIFPGGVASRTTRLGRVHHIIVIDGSYSMARRHHDGSSFERALRWARSRIQQASPGDGFSLIVLGTPTQTIVAGPSENAASVLKEIDDLRLAHGNADLATGLDAVERLVSQPLGKYQQREVYLLTDLQRTLFQSSGLRILQSKSPASESVGDRVGELDAWQRIQARAPVIVVDVSEGNADNLAVTSIALGEPLTLVGTLNSVTATIHNFGSVERKQLKVDLLVGKARSASGADTTDSEPFALRIQQQLLVDLPAGAAVPVTFPLTFLAAGEYVVQVRIESDALEVDNARSLVTSVKESIPVLLINGKPAADRDSEATYHLATALQPLGAGTGLGAPLSPFRPRVITEAQFADVGLGDLGPYDCVFVCDVARLTERKVARLENFLRRGGGVIFTLGSQVDPEAFNRLLYRDGNGLVPAELVARKRAPEDQFFTLAAADEAFQQPPLAAFTAENDRATLLNARFRQYYQVRLPAKVPARRLLSFLPPVSENSRGDTPNVGSGGLDPAVLEWPRYRGRVILITTTVNIDWGSWPGSPAYLPFMHELARYAALSAPPRVVQVGEPLVDYLPMRWAGFKARLTTPDGRETELRLDGQEDVIPVRFTETDQSGIYRLTIENHPQEYLYAVNPPHTITSALASESDLTRIEPAELEASGSEGDVQVVRELGEIRHKARTTVASEQDETVPRSTAGPVVARYILLAFLILLVLEMLLAWRFGSARTVVPPAASLAQVASQPSPRRWLASLSQVVLLVPLWGAIGLGLTLIHEAARGEFLGFLPAAWRQTIEQWLEVGEAAPGEGTRWRLEYLPYLTGDAVTDRWLVAGGLIGLALVALGIYRAERIALRVQVPGEATPRRSIFTVAGLRLAMLGLTMIVLLPQLRLTFEREGWPDLAIVIDTSRSFGIPDDFQDQDVRRRAEELAATWQSLATPGIEKLRQQLQASQALGAPPHQIAEGREHLEEWQTASRLNLVKALIAGPSPNWLNDLLSRRQVKIHLYEINSRVNKLAEVIDAIGAQKAGDTIRELRALGDSSQLGNGVRAILNEFRGGSLGGIIMFTDGVTTEGDELVPAARHAARADVPLFLVGVGDALEPRDLFLHDLQSEDTANVRDRHVFDVRVSVRGRLAATTVPAILWEKKPDGTLVELKRTTVDLNPRLPVKVRLTAIPTEPGDHTYVITVPDQPDETDKSNNRVEKLVHVFDARPVKVLYIEGYPRYEYRYVKALLEREAATAQGNRSVQLKVLLVDADRDFATQDRSALAEIPPRDELFAYDVVILGDVTPDHPLMGRKHLELLREFVRERGGGLLTIAGEQAMPHAYFDTPLADVLPILPSGTGDRADPRERELSQLGLVTGFRLRLASAGWQHPIFRLAAEEADNAAIWNGLAPLYFASTGYRAKPSAEVLATHPQILARRGPGDADQDLHPLVVQAFVGAGRSLFFGFDETWRWRFRDNEPRFNQFWQQTVQYLARHRLGRVDLRLDRQSAYQRNEPIRVTVRFPDDAPAPPPETPVRVLVERFRLRRGGEKVSDLLETQTLTLARAKNSRGTFETLLTRTPEGDYKFSLVSPTVEGPRPQVETRVLPPPGELDRLRMNQSEMEQAARESRGRFYTLADADRLVAELPSGTRVTLNQPRPPWPLWNHAIVFVLALGLLTSEWILRKQRRLL